MAPGRGPRIPPPACIPKLLQAQAERTPDAIALMAPGRVPLTYSRLHAHMHDVVQTLHAIGLHRNDRVAVILPNGPEMAAAFLTVGAAATCVPLNPAYSAEECEADLTRLHVQALILPAGWDSPARAVAQAHNLHVLDLRFKPEAAAGLFTLTSERRPSPATCGFALPEDVALILRTSGMTSQPKVVQLTHGNICASAYAMHTLLELEDNDRCLNVLSLFHVYGLVGTLLTSLMAGASIVCAPGFDASQFFAWMAEFRPTWYAGFPTMFQVLLEHARANRAITAGYPLRFIRSGSAPLPPRFQAELERVFNAPVIEAYGMTETSSQITCNPLPPLLRKPGSVGTAAGPEVAIMDERGTVLPVGTIGEIVVRGASVFHGYDNDPAANHQAFRNGWFRTGDAGFLDADGYLFVSGRLHDMIHHSGQRIAPREVDEVLLDHPAVMQAITFAVPDTQLGEDIAATVVLRPNAVATASEIRQFAAARLAEIKVPRHVLIVDAIPQSASGKLQRLGLAEKFGLTTPPCAQTGVGKNILAPYAQVEEVLAGLWSQVLGLEHDVGRHDNFFQLGGDSLLATQLLSRVNAVFHVELAFHSFLQMPTVAGMASSIDMSSQTTSSPSLHMQPISREQSLPLSYAQQRLWLIEQLGLSRHAYNLLRVLQLRGHLCVDALQQSLQEIVRRHEVLRTTFVVVAGQPLQVLGPAIPVSLPVVNLQGLLERERMAQVHRLAREAVQQTFDLAQGPLLRVQVLRLRPEEHVLLLTMHHIVSDGWSHGLFFKELAALYRAYTTGRCSPLPEPLLQYADFAYWQRQRLQGDVLEDLLTYWKRQLADVSALQLPTDRPRPAVQSFRGARQPLTFSVMLTQRLKALSRHHGVTFFMMLLAAFQVLLRRYTGQDDIPVGSLIANRHHVETEGLIGFFVNTLVLRTNLAGDPSFQECLYRVRQTALGAYMYQDLPFERLLEELQPPRDLSRNPLFQVLFVLQYTPSQAWQLPGLTVSALEVDTETAKFDLTLDLRDTPEGLCGWFEYNTDLFDAGTIARLAGHFQTLVQGVLTDPTQPISTLPMLTTAERHCLLVEWNRTRADYPSDQCIHQVFEARVKRTPDAVAVVCGGVSLTYHELNRRANQVAHHLRTLGVGPEVLVGLCMERSLEMVVGLLGILKAGAAYVPLDPAYPSERLAFMLKDSQVLVLLTQKRLITSIPNSGATLICVDTQWSTLAQQSDQNPGSGTTPDNLAYVLYTSGSTGKPKGVLGVHRATLNALAWMWQAYPFGPQEVCCQKTSMSFGDSIQEIFSPLLQGVCTVLIPHEVLQDPSRLVQTLAIHRVTRIILVPSLLRVLLDTYDDLGDRLPGLRLWFVGGETLSPEICQRFREHMPYHRLINLYGASESSDDTTWYDTTVMPQECPYLPIGRPIANTQSYVLDRSLQLVPVGVPGELHIAGLGLTRGYLNHPDLNAEKFIPNPFNTEPGARLYKTGDLVRYLPDSNLQFLGRLDYQVKIRGRRIEPGEIETALRKHPTVQETAVIVDQDIHGEKRLVAYVVLAHALSSSDRGLRRFLARDLPDFMIPAIFVRLETLPLTPSGKVDRRALPLPDHTRPNLEQPFVAPRTSVESQIAALWSHLLGLEKIGIHDNFFELGGHSLMAMQLVYRVRDAMDVDMSLLNFWESPTVAEMARIVGTTTQKTQKTQTSAVLPVPRHNPLPASVAQEQLWAIEQVLPGSPFFHMPYALRLTGAPNIAVLEHSLTEIIRRHDVLRTTFVFRSGQLVQVVVPTLSIPLDVTDLSTLSAGEREDAARQLAREEVYRSFDLIQGPLLRSRLLRLNEQEHVLLLTMHHIIGDGWSLGVLSYELVVLYNAFVTGSPSPLPELPIQYADFVCWQRQWQHSAEHAAQLAYWQHQLRDPLPVLQLPTDRPRTTEPWSVLRTARQPVVFPKALSEALKSVSRQQGSSLFMTLLAAFKILLYGYTGQEDLRVGSLVANRHRQETEKLIGLLVNTVIFRTDLGGHPTYQEVLQRVRATTLAAYAHQDLPFEDLVQTLEREQNLRRAELCQVMFILQDGMQPPPQPAASSLRFFETDPYRVALDSLATTFEVVLMLRDRPEGLTGACLYKPDIFETRTIQRLLEDFQRVLERLVAKLEQPLTVFYSPGNDRGGRV